VRAPGAAHDQVANSVDQLRLSNSGGLAMLAAIRRCAAGGEKVFPSHDLETVDACE